MYNITLCPYLIVRKDGVHCVHVHILQTTLKRHLYKYSVNEIYISNELEL